MLICQFPSYQILYPACNASVQTIIGQHGDMNNFREKNILGAFCLSNLWLAYALLIGLVKQEMGLGSLSSYEIDN